MIYINLYCKRDKLKEWKKWVKESGREGYPFEDHNDGDGLYVGGITQGPRVMHYYFRLLCISAYRRIAKGEKAAYDAYSKAEILNTLLKVCPDRAEKLGYCNHDGNSKALQDLLRGMFPGNPRDEAAPKVDMQLLETDFTVRRHLAAIGLHPMADWVIEGCQTDNVSSQVITACAKMFTEYLKDVPVEAKDLEGTPYARSEENEDITDNLDSNGCVEYKEELEPDFRNAAQFGDSCYGVHT